MLRLFRNFLCLASVLQVGTAVQAQQPPAKAATTPAAKVQPVSSTKPAKKEPVAVSTKAPSPASLAKPSAAKPEPAAVAPKPAKAEPAAATPKSAKAAPVPPTPKSAKAEPTAATPKSAKAEPASAAAAAAKPAKADPATPSVKSAKESALPPLKSGPAKPVKSDSASKSGKGSEKVVQQHSSAPRLGLVPPPPPDTPTMFAGDGFPPGFGMVDYNNPAVLAGRRKDIASQLASAKKMLIDKEQRSKELKEKAVQFEQLFSEGVISRRELESAQKDSASAITELADAKTQATAYQNAISRLDDRIKPKSVAAKKSVKGKSKAAGKSSVKVAGASVTPVKPAVTAAVTTTTTTTTTTTSATDSSAQTAIKATPGP